MQLRCFRLVRRTPGLSDDTHSATCHWGWVAPDESGQLILVRKYENRGAGDPAATVQIELSVPPITGIYDTHADAAGIWNVSLKGTLMRRARFSLALFSTFLLSCSPLPGIEGAENGVVTFHKRYNLRQFHEIYVHADPSLRQGATEPDSAAYIKHVYRRLGRVKHTKRIGWHLAIYTTGTQVTLAYETEFERGRGTEEFGFRIHGQQARLTRYSVKSTTPE